DPVGEAVVVLEAGAEEPIPRRLVGFVRGLGAPVGNIRARRLDLVQALPLGRRRVDLELEEVEGEGRRRGGEPGQRREDHPARTVGPAPGAVRPRGGRRRRPARTPWSGGGPRPWEGSRRRRPAPRGATAAIGNRSARRGSPRAGFRREPAT